MDKLLTHHEWLYLMRNFGQLIYNFTSTKLFNCQQLGIVTSLHQLFIWLFTTIKNGLIL